VLDSGINEALLPVTASVLDVRNGGKTRHAHSGRKNPALEVDGYEATANFARALNENAIPVQDVMRPTFLLFVKLDFVRHDFPIYSSS
jgi:hypothetical protein